MTVNKTTTEEKTTKQVDMDELDQELSEAAEDGEECDSLTEELVSERSARWEQEKEDLLNQLARLQADFNNYRRRTQKQMSEMQESANAGLLHDLLPVIDHLEMAVQSGDGSPLATGVKMVLQQLLNTLDQVGLKQIQALGCPFDLEYHEAVSMEGDASDNLVVTLELKKGYVYNNRVLRHSVVHVAPSEKREDE